MRTALVSDLHLGMVSGRDLARHPAARAALCDRVRGADRVVLLGDVLELRETPLAAALDQSEPFFRELGKAAGGARITIVPGNHDHRLAAPLIEAWRLEGAAGLTEDRSEPAPSTGPLARIADWLGSPELRLAYPGVWVRPDVYATHGHYLDCHLRIPTFERLAIAATARVVGWPDAGERKPDHYEAVVQPLYDLSYGLAQASHGGRRLLGSGRSVAAWEQLSGADGRPRLGARVVAGAVVPGAVGLLNMAGLGPLTADLSGSSLRRSGLDAMAAVAASLGVDTGHVVFGHTHRSGPWARDDTAEWALPGGGRLVNTGSWVYEPAFLGRSPSASPYWPGTVVTVDDAEPPRLERLLDELPPSFATRSGP